MIGNYLISYSAKVGGEWYSNLQYYGYGTRGEVVALFNVDARNGDLTPYGKVEVRIDKIIFSD